MWREEKGKRIRGGGKAISDLLEGGRRNFCMEKFRVGNSLRYILRVVQFVQRG